MESNCDVSWGGFGATDYSIDVSVLLALPLASPASPEVSAPTPTTVGELLTLVLDRGPAVLPPSELLCDGTGRSGFRLATDTGDILVPHSSFAGQLASLFLALRRESIELTDTSWFWFDSDSVTDDPHESHAFFVVHRDAMIRERVAFSDCAGSGFDPRLFVAEEESDPIWLSDKGWADARVRYWYRRFYKETPTGQMMVLRSDEPDLFHYPEGRILRLLMKYPQWDDDALVRLTSLMLER